MLVFVSGVADGDGDLDRDRVVINLFVFVCIEVYNTFKHGGAETHRDVDRTDKLLIFELYEGV